ncbi:Disease resistance protein RGA3 [Cocos nucifera]|uniref:Disease resistance protein RGA3 n=1 Tax=Cocos nucifera TaxID=13894 RepID=A0A8K0IFP5_COCNU|nr:Disease resistance protein RGA3 [Cocos nucifera]
MTGGGDVLSAFLQVLFQNLFTLLSEIYGADEELRNLKDNLSTIQAVLRDAEERPPADEAVKLWLNDLRGLAYKATDVLDEFATEVERRRLIPYARVRNSLSFINPTRGLFWLRMSHKIKPIANELDVIIKRRNLRVGDGMTNREERGDHRESSSLLNPSLPLGRESDKQRIVELLVSSHMESGGNISVVAIHGMCGIGKTTLTQLVYDDEAIKKHFELTLWIHVSYDFNVNKLTKAMIESMDSCAYPLDYLDNLQKHLKEKLAGKRYLLVLDDVWNDDPVEWERLRVPLLYGAKGSKILVTTRIEVVADIISTSSPYYLQGLSDDDCWSLFCRYAFARDQQNFSDLDDIGREIVNKCKGSPLAAIALGHRLSRVADRSKWEAILQGEDWEFSGENSDISRAVRPSYQQLPSYLKPCFAYCSLIPKGYEFEKEFVVQLWMAQHFIQPRGEELIEDIAGSYFDTLVQRSFFQFSHFDYSSGQPRYTMHNLIHNYAQRVAAEDCCILQLGRRPNDPAKTRHLSLIGNQFVRDDSTQSNLSNRKESMFEDIYKCRGLYTLLLAGGYRTYEMRIPNKLAKRLKRLRTLDLSHSSLTMLPKSIGTLKHLRCLQLRNTNITRLPESVGCLYNLQILGLRNCDIVELPWNTRNLRKLRHLDLRLDDDSVLGTEGAKSRVHNLRSMPPEIGLLTELQTLSRFVVATYKSGISELKDLNDLHGELLISNLHLVLDAAEALEANLAGKRYIHRLELRWSYSRGVHDEKVLDSLQPHTNLRELRIVGYGGASFPDWICHSSFSNLVILSLSDCGKCEVLPPLGQMPVLKELYVKGMDSVKRVDCSFCGHDGRKFPSLQKLHFESMHCLQVWCGDDNCLLTSLRELVFKNCTNLRQLTHNLPSLTKLEIEGSPKLVGLRSFPSLQSLEVKASGEWVFSSWSSVASLSSLTLSRLPAISLRSELQPGHASISCLEISHCDQLVSLPDNWLPSSLTYFAIKHCSQLRALPRGLQNLGELEDLEIQNCGQLQYLPDGLKNLTSLVRFEISDCPQLLCLPNDGLPTKLRFLSIDNCPELRRRCKEEVGEDWPKIEHIFSLWIDKQLVVSSVQPRREGQTERPLNEGIKAMNSFRSLIVIVMRSKKVSRMGII